MSTTITHNIRTPDGSSWITDWTTTIQEDNSYTITPSENWKIPITNIVGTVTDDSSDLERNIVTYTYSKNSHSSGATGIPIINNDGIVERFVTGLNIENKNNDRVIISDSDNSTLFNFVQISYDPDNKTLIFPYPQFLNEIPSFSTSTISELIQIAIPSL